LKPQFGFRFLRCFLLSGFIAASLWCSIETVVDPRGYFGEALFSPVIPSPRVIKAELLGAYLKLRPVTGLVVGSSRTMMLDPRMLDPLLGASFFNAGVYMGKPEDFLAFYRLAGTRGAHLKCMVIGIDDSSLNDVDSFDPDLVASYPLISELEPWRKFPLVKIFHLLRLYKDSMSSAGFREIRESLAGRTSGRLKHYPPQAVEFDSLSYYQKDGALLQVRPDEFKRNSTYETFLMEQLLKMTRLSPRRMADLETLLSEMKRDHVRGVIFITAYHPAFLKEIRENASAWHHHMEAVAYLESLRERFGFPVLDFTDPATFGARPDKWKDVVHFGGDESRKVVERLALAMGGN
jgi:hypothetical protein